MNLEVAERSLGRPPEAAAVGGLERARAGLSTIRREIERASAMLDVLPEIARRLPGAGEPFDLGEALSRALVQARPFLAVRSLSLVVPSDFPPLPVAGSADQAVQAFADVLAAAAGEAAPGVCRVTFDGEGGHARVTVRVPMRQGRAPGTLFRLSTGADGPSPGPGLFLARVTFECLGGRLEAAAAEGALTLAVTVPAASP